VVETRRAPLLLRCVRHAVNVIVCGCLFGMALHGLLFLGCLLSIILSGLYLVAPDTAVANAAFGVSHGMFWAARQDAAHAAIGYGLALVVEFSGRPRWLARVTNRLRFHHDSWSAKSGETAPPAEA
jgi:hypothetical protein